MRTSAIEFLSFVRFLVGAGFVVAGSILLWFGEWIGGEEW